MDHDLARLWKHVQTSVRQCLDSMSVLDFQPRYGLNEAGLKAIILMALAHGCKSKDIWYSHHSEVTIGKYRADLVINFEDYQETHLVELKYIPSMSIKLPVNPVQAEELQDSAPFATRFTALERVTQYVQQCHIDKTLMRVALDPTSSHAVAGAASVEAVVHGALQQGSVTAAHLAEREQRASLANGREVQLYNRVQVVGAVGIVNAFVCKFLKREEWIKAAKEFKAKLTLPSVPPLPAAAATATASAATAAATATAVATAPAPATDHANNTTTSSSSSNSSRTNSIDTSTLIAREESKQLPSFRVSAAVAESFTSIDHTSVSSSNSVRSNIPSSSASPAQDYSSFSPSSLAHCVRKADEAAEVEEGTEGESPSSEQETQKPASSSDAMRKQQDDSALTCTPSVSSSSTSSLYKRHRPGTR